MDLKRYGVFLFNEGIPAAELRTTVQSIERLGYGAVWFPEAIGREPFATASLILNSTETLIAATGIVNVHGRDPMVTAMGQQTLNEMSGGRFLLGLGVSHKMFVEPQGHTYGKPLATMRQYVDGIVQCHGMVAVHKNLAIEGVSAQAVTRGPNGVLTTATGEQPIVLAALGPKMTALAGRIAQGAHPYNTTPAHTRRARQILGPDKWLCPMQRVCLCDDPQRARALGRRLLDLYLQLPNYCNMLLGCGYTAADFANGGSDRLVDQLLGWGDREAIKAHVQAHIDAGASHVAVQPINIEDPGRPCLRALETIIAG